jgi:DNA-binding transcriptional MerR regulator
MRTAQLAEAAAVKRPTLRYYERRGLLPPADRSAAGYRSYGPDAVRIVRFVKHAQEIGFTLSEVEALLEGPTPVTWSTRPSSP